MDWISTLRLLVFDLDGTLIDSSGDLADSINALLSHLRRPPLPEEQILQYVGNGAAVLVRLSLGMSAEEARENPEFAAALAFFLDHYQQHLLVRTRPYAGVEGLLPRLAERFNLAVLTNKPARATLAILDGLKMRPYFRAVLGGDSLPTRKPDPSGLRQICAGLFATGAETLMIGDSAVDMATAQAAGTRSCACQYGFAPQSLNEIAVDWRITSFAELERLL